MRADEDSRSFHPAPESAFGFTGPAEIIAHRGFSAAAPENTLAALEAAVAAGADALEFDLQVSADGEPLLLHDASLERTTDGRGAVGDLPWRKLARLDAGAWFAPAFRGEPLPLLAEALERVRGRVGRLYPELKDVRRSEDADRVVQVVDEAGCFEQVVFISIDWNVLTRIRERAPGASVGYIVTEAADAREAVARASGDPRALVDFDYRIPLARPELAEAAHRAGVQMAAWTVDEAGDAARLVDLGIPRITTNQVQRMVAWKRGLNTDPGGAPIY